MYNRQSPLSCPFALVAAPTFPHSCSRSLPFSTNLPLTATMVKSHASIPGLVAWDVIRGTNSSIVTKKGVTFARGNLGNKHSYKFSVAQPTVDVVLGADKKSISLVSARGTTPIKGAKDAEAQINALSNTYRPDLRVTALRKYTALKRSLRPRHNVAKFKAGRTSDFTLGQ